jgi:UDP-N-acetylmuramoyl-tripeptide--D-alanyl-D-alanine ligase
MKELFRKIIVYILIIESRLILLKYKPKIVAITGSVGKTSTKDAVFAVLSKYAYVRKSEKSFNSQIGLPLTILGCPNGWSNPLTWVKNIFIGLWLIIKTQPYPEWLVLEVGVGKPGDMAETASWLATDIVILTAIGDTPVHVEFFKSRNHLVEEKSGLINTLKKDGHLILNIDDPDVFNMRNKSKNRIFTYGFNKEADMYASEENIFYEEEKPKGVIFRVDEKGSSVPVLINGVFGRNHVYASLSALAFASVLKFNLLESAQVFKDYDFPPGRMCLIEGVNNSLVIDDTYNSSPFACKAAINTLANVSAQRKIVVLGDMLELGKHTEEAHKDIGHLVALLRIDFLFVVGPRAKNFALGALEKDYNKENIFEFNNSKEAGDFLQSFVQKGDMILVKGSQGVRMEKTVEKIMLNPEKKKDLLVRQDEEWLKR